MEELHLSQTSKVLSKKYGDKAIFYSQNQENNSWEPLSWTDFDQQVSVVSKALVELEVSEEACVGQFSQNMTENLVVDYALYAIRSVMVPFYATATAAQVNFIVNDANIELIFVGEQKQYDVAMEVLKGSKILKKIIVFDSKVQLSDTEKSMYYTDFYAIGEVSTKHFEVETRQNEANESDLACILYTSGTTGNPKGVMMPHSCFMETIRIHKIRLNNLTDEDISIAFLPLSHVFERTWTYFCINMGMAVYMNLQPIQIQQTIKEVRPT